MRRQIVRAILSADSASYGLVPKERERNITLDHVLDNQLMAPNLVVLAGASSLYTLYVRAFMGMMYICMVYYIYLMYN